QRLREGRFGGRRGRVQRAAARGPPEGAPARHVGGGPGRGPPVKPALLIAGHGTRDPEGVAGFTALTKRLTALAEAGRVQPAEAREKPPDAAGCDAVDEAGGERLDVAGGFIELSAPPLRDAVSGLVDQGNRILVA